MAKLSPSILSADFANLERDIRNIAENGAMAKEMIWDEIVSVNGEICTMRGKKLRLGDTATVEGKSLVIENAG